MTKERIRIAIIIKDYLVDRWQYTIIEKIHNSYFAEVVLIIFNDATLPDNGFIPVLLNLCRTFISRIHIKLDEIVFGKNLTSIKKSDLHEILNNISEIKMDLSKSQLCDEIELVNINVLKKINPDVILNFVSGKIDSPILSIPKYGIWSYLFRDNRLDNNDLTAYWEVCQNRGIIGSVLQMQNGESAGSRALYRSWSHIKSPSISITRNSLYWKSSLFIPRILTNLYEIGDLYFNELIKQFNSEFEIHNETLNIFPTNLEAAKNIINHFTGILRYLVYSKILYNYSWLILFNKNSDSCPSYCFHKFKKLIPPKGKFWADPFLVTKSGKHFIFIEELIYKTFKGHISVIVLDEKEELIEIKEVLKRSYHLSYPFIFAHQNAFFMIPETVGNRTIELYRCVEFPDKWEFVMNLMEDVYAVDSTLFYHENIWWLFTNIDETCGKVNSSDELFLFYSNDLFSNKWEKHPKNPIISDIKYARPAGNLFTLDNKIYRPSQNNSGLYGRAINLNHILKLSQTEYLENPDSIIEPTWDKKIEGTHTLNFNSFLTVIDGFYYQRKLF
jgi:hypothetical protein